MKETNKTNKLKYKKMDKQGGVFNVKTTYRSIEVVVQGRLIPYLTKTLSNDFETPIVLFKQGSEF